MKADVFQFIEAPHQRVALLISNPKGQLLVMGSAIYPVKAVR